MHITVMNRQEAIAYSKHTDVTEKRFMISIGLPDRNYTEWPVKGNSIQDILFVDFFDVMGQSATPDCPAISDEIANKIAETVTSWVDAGAQNIIVHCDAGMSRSAAVAMAIGIHFQVPESNIAYMHQTAANHTVYAKVLRALKNYQDQRTPWLSETILRNLQAIEIHAKQLPVLANANTFTETRKDRIIDACSRRRIALVRELIMPMTWSVERDRIDASAKMRCSLIHRSVSDCYREIASEAYHTLGQIIVNMPGEIKLSENLDKLMQGMFYENVDIAMLRNKILDLQGSVFQTNKPNEVEAIQANLKLAADQLSILIMDA